MDHALRTISFIADIADVLVIMVRRFPPVTSELCSGHTATAMTNKICCHVLETDEVRISRLMAERVFVRCQGKVQLNFGLFLLT